ncbi:MAG: hypothetical protein LBU13_00830, partial [Synergistaceae bacterium]|nr:hypothetical protein [Synergistaceae bacterium]
MAVQLASSARDFANVCVVTKTGPNPGGTGPRETSPGDGGSEFKNILQDVRESRQKPAKAGQTAKTAGKEPKTPANFAFFSGEEGEIPANPESTAVKTAELEKTPDTAQEAKKTSRFDPDVFLEALEATVAGKPGKSGTATDAETDDLASEEGMADQEATAETPKTGAPVLGESNELSESGGLSESD